jgi:hypothetical protein
VPSAERPARVRLWCRVDNAISSVEVSAPRA